jgi:hypothetical protein
MADGVVPPEGSPWDAAGAVKLAPASSVTIELPEIPPGAGMVEGIWLTADCNDHYRIEGSVDGSEFRLLHTAGPTEGWGLQSQAVFFNDDTPWSALRITPVGGDGSYSIAEIAPIVADGLRLEMGTAAARVALGEGWSTDETSGPISWVWAIGKRASCEVALRPGLPYDLELTVAPPPADEPQRIDVAVNGSPIGQLTLAPGPNTYHLLVPAAVVNERNLVQFGFAHLAPPSAREQRHLAASFDRLVFRRIDRIARWATTSP